ncbi:MAG: type IVB secretion system protein IcmH/DotU [Pseudomonadota bacterium]|nr:type IVB secretion system protein IcmH/DotU [Pseudomonadota bacterium]
MNDKDRTIIRPRPGRGDLSSVSSSPQAPSSVPERGFTALDPQSRAWLSRHGVNPLIDAASVLISVIIQLRDNAAVPDPMQLRGQLVDEIKQFETEARRSVDNPAVISAARYSLCSVIDEMVLKTSWGGSSAWSSQSLLSTFHNETWGGEKFFQILDRLLAEPERNTELLELMFLCLGLGFEGKYGIMDNGRALLDDLEERVFRAIQRNRGDFERELSPHWQGAKIATRTLGRSVPPWVVAAVTSALLLVIFVTFAVVQHQASDDVRDQLARIATSADAATQDQSQ